MKRLLAKQVPTLIGLLFLYSGFYKLIFPGEATAALIALGVGTKYALAAIAAVTAIEIYLGTILLLKIDLKNGLGVATALVLAFSLFLAALSTLAHPPSCGCMGLAAIFRSHKHNAILGLARNVLILWMLKWAYDYYFPTKPGTSVRVETSELTRRT